MSVTQKRIGNVDFTLIDVDDMTNDELKRYIKFIEENTHQYPDTIQIRGCADGMIDLSYESKQSFERIRRI